MKHLTGKIFLGYIVLFCFAAMFGWIIHSFFDPSNNADNELHPINDKVLYINSILTNLYQAEGIERLPSQTKSQEAFDKYEGLVSNIFLQIDTLRSMFNNPTVIEDIDSLKTLLNQKVKYGKQLYWIRNQNTLDEFYEKTYKNLTIKNDSVKIAKQISQKSNISYDTTYVAKIAEEPLIKRLRNLFVPNKDSDTIAQIRISHHTEIDSSIYKINAADSIIKMLTQVIEDMKVQIKEKEHQSYIKEKMIMDNNYILSLKLRQILSNIEQEELVLSYQELLQRQERIKNDKQRIFLLGLLALFVLLFFMINIFKDISNSKKYNTQLENAKAFSDTLLKDKEQLMLTLTHDLKTPLNSIIGYTHLLKESVDESEKSKTSRYLLNIHKSTDYILKLVQNLLDLARLQSGKIKLEYKTFNMNQLLDSIIERVRPEAIDKNIKLINQTEIDKSLYFKGDPFRLSQILLNLLANALKFTKEGYVKMEASTVKIYGKTQVLKIKISDTGIGISDNDIETIFKEFNRGTGEGQQFEGSGLGLAITKKLVTLLNGKIKVESGLEKGSNFFIQIPVELGKKPEKEEYSYFESGKSLSKEKYNLQDLHVWLVDDDKTLLEMITAVLQKEKIKVTAFSDAEVAKNKFSKNCADLLITDIQMPGLSGFSLLSQIEEVNGQKIKSIAVSGMDDFAENKEAVTFSAFLKKPFVPNDLIRTIAKLFGRQVNTTIAKKEGNNKLYNLNNILQFAGGDKESENLILESFIDESSKHLKMLKIYIENKDYGSLKELAHKMLNLFRQIEYKEIIDQLVFLEKNALNTNYHEDCINKASVAYQNMKDLFIQIKKDRG